MTKESSLPTLVKDLHYIVLLVPQVEFLFAIFPPQEDAKVLDAGCGSGKFSLSYALRGCEAWAIDPALDARLHAKKLAAALRALGAKFNLHIMKRSVLKLAFPDNHFDLVFSEAVPEHWTDDERRQTCINEMVRASKDTVILICSNGENPRQQEVDKTQEFDYVGMSPIRRCFTRKELAEKMEKAGLVNVQVAPLGASFIDATEIGGWGRKRY